MPLPLVSRILAVEQAWFAWLQGTRQNSGLPNLGFLGAGLPDRSGAVRTDGRVGVAAGQHLARVA